MLRHVTSLMTSFSIHFGNSSDLNILFVGGILTVGITDGGIKYPKVLTEPDNATSDLNILFVGGILTVGITDGGIKYPKVLTGPDNATSDLNILFVGGILTVGITDGSIKYPKVLTGPDNATVVVMEQMNCRNRFKFLV